VPSTPGLANDELGFTAHEYGNQPFHDGERAWGAVVTMPAEQLPPIQTPDVLTVALGDRAYPIIIGAGVLDEVGARLAGQMRAQACAVVTNPTIAKLYLNRTVQSLRSAGFAPVTVEVPDGEQHKNLSTLQLIYNRLAAAKLERSAPLIALGGGVIGDLTGFAAATYLRGVPYVQLPTTLLAQVDSSVGGKTGVDHPAGKNLIGAFYQPRLVLADVTTLVTLPHRELVAGLVEVIKYGVILDAELFTLVENELERVLNVEVSWLQEIVRRCCAIKAEVVRRDERESDYRSILNFAIGMAFAAKLSRVHGICSQETEVRIVRLLRRAGLDVDVPSGLRASDVRAAVASDKKMEGGKVKFVCVEDLGRARFEMMTSEEIGRLAMQGSTDGEG